MSRRKKIIFGLFGALIGLCIGTLLRNYRTLELISVCNLKVNAKLQTPLEIINLRPDETPQNSQKNLVFIGVMTAKNFLKGRARAVYNTWGKSVPGRIGFFSSEGSVSEDLPVIALKGVDDRYPPQKKSFMMLHYMYEHYIDRFEWFMRADDDVFMRTDKLEKFLRSIDSSKPQFIGQAGRGNNEEFGLLSLEFDENFCMGGPGVILSRETLRRVAPHIPTCLKNLYSTHEDVEVGRCIQKFAGIPCTWNYEMQSILHHNSSGNRAFTGNLKNKEVHSAITLHPIKKAPLMYRLHAYMLGLRVQELRQEVLYLHRDIELMKNILEIPKTNKMLAPAVPLFPVKETDSNYLGDPHILGINPDLNRYQPTSTENILEWDFIAKSVYSGTHPNPKRKIETALKEGLDDVIREVMENINNFSRQRGRVIEFRELLYGYSRVNTIHGQDLILDLLLIYKKYRGKKMTVPVRRHLYIQRSFTEMRIREIGDASDIYASKFNSSPSSSQSSSTNNDGIRMPIHDTVKKFLNTGLERISDTFSLSSSFLERQHQEQLKKQQEIDESKIAFVLPISGRFETFLRFLNNYEEVCIKSSAATTIKTQLLIILFLDTSNENHDGDNDNNDDDNNNKFIEVITYLNKKHNKHSINFIQIDGKFSRGVALDKATRSNYIQNNDILLFIDVDLIFNVDTLYRIKQNTIKNKQIYLPIVFSQYDPSVMNSGYNGTDTDQDVTKLINGDSITMYHNFNRNYIYHKNSMKIITNKNGFFRQFGYGICSVYKEDVINPLVDGFNTDIIGWGLEDVKFLEKIINLNKRQNSLILQISNTKDDQTQPQSPQQQEPQPQPQPQQQQTTTTNTINNNLYLKIFRSPDPSLVHIFHKIYCDKELEEGQYRMCLGTKANTLGNYHLIESIFLSNKLILEYVRKVNSNNNNVNDNNNNNVK